MTYLVYNKTTLLSITRKSKDLRNVINSPVGTYNIEEHPFSMQIAAQTNLDTANTSSMISDVAAPGGWLPENIATFALAEHRSNIRLNNSNDAKLFMLSLKMQPAVSVVGMYCLCKLIWRTFVQRSVCIHNRVSKCQQLNHCTLAIYDYTCWNTTNHFICYHIKYREY